MLLLVATLGGLLLMMGHHSRSESLFYYFRIEDQVPENHLLRLIDRHVSFQFVRDELRDSYSDGGRPSITRKCCCGSCCWVICTASPASGSCWRSCACIWPGAGLLDWALSRRFPITPPFLRIDMVASSSPECFRSCLSALSSNAWQWGWCRASRCRWMAASSKPTRITTAAFPANS